MILKQYYLGCLAHASYLLGDEASSTAVIVDPQRDIQQYLADAEKFGLQIRHVFLTHFHADFVAGHLELRDHCGATIHLGSRAQAEYTFVAMKDGDTLDFPGMRLQILETPGHTIESISILVFDLQKNPVKPYAVLTGDTLFIGDVGRPDLRASLGWTANDLGAHLYDSLHNKLLPLPDETLVYPAHGAGSLCGKKLSSDTVSSLGDQRRLNYALQPMSKDEFIRLVTADQPMLRHTSPTTPSSTPGSAQRWIRLWNTLSNPSIWTRFCGWAMPGLRSSTFVTPVNMLKATWPAASTSGSVGNTQRGRARFSTATSLS
jgi:glyoxylase-like metal-dependent hydrolase (beta-lactamase superfamily II)